tara:strand:- start:5137 stop:5268 length:132 start_codon:yes stop_codon:yes gene_type:complete
MSIPAAWGLTISIEIDASIVFKNLNSSKEMCFWPVNILIGVPE